jgi:hypothetical protein
VRFSFSKFFSVLAKFHVLQCAFLIFHVFQCFYHFSQSYCVCVSFSTFFQFSHHVPSTPVCVTHFSTFLVYPHISGPIVCTSHFQRFSVFLPYSRSCSVHFVFSKFFFLMILAMFQVILCLCLIFNIFQYSYYIPESHTVHFHFPHFSVFLENFQAI